MTDIDVSTAQDSRERFGLITRARLVELGVSRRTVQRRMAAGAWSRVAPGVIDLGTHTESWQRELMTLLLAAGSGAVVSHRSAGHLHGFLDVRRPEPHEITVSRGRATSLTGARLHTTTRLPPEDVGTVDAFPVTLPARTLLDMASELPVEELEPIVWDASRRDPKLTAAIAAATERHPRAPGCGRLAKVVAALHPELAGAESPLEVHGLLALRRAGAPPPTLQLVVRDEAGRFVARVDAAWPGSRVIVEFDGAAYHSTPRQLAADRERRERLHALGWEVHVLRFADLRSSLVQAVVARVRQRAGRDAGGA